MSPREWRHRVKDIQESIGKITAYTSEMDFEDFRGDSKTVDAVIRNLIVIGEAAGRMPPEVIAAHPEIPWRLMGDMRNFAVHEYWGVELLTIWETIKKDLPPLTKALAAVVGE